MKREPVKRRYDPTARREAAARTRTSILEAARGLFVEQGYAATTMAAVAHAAGISLDTIYASVGTKQVLFRALIETAISGTDQAVPATDRSYVVAIRAEPDARAKLTLYAAAIRRIHERLAPLVRVLKEVATIDAELAAIWTTIAERRAKNMRIFAADLAATGQLRPNIGLDDVADEIWALGSPESYLLLVGERGWAPEKFELWLADAWIRLLLR